MRMGSRKKLRLVVVPSDPISSYERNGIDWLRSYYNPTGIFDEVFAVSPLETGQRDAHGMTILGVKASRFSHVLRDIQPDVVRAYGGFWPADLVCRHRVKGIPVVVSVHDSDPSHIFRSLRYADLVICISKVVAKRAEDVGVEKNRIRILPNRVDTNVFQPVRDEISLQCVASHFPQGKYILHVGRKAHEKGIDTVIRTLALLPYVYSCIFIGRGDTAPYRSLADQTGVSERCFWVEAVNNSELPLWYSWCRCMCVPSRWEGFGIVFIEAAACGAPIVTSDIEPMNEYLTHNESAFLVKDYENSEALAGAILKVCEDNGYRRKISSGAVKASQVFDRQIVDAAEAAIYREAMSLPALAVKKRLGLSVWKIKNTIDHLPGRLSKRFPASFKHKIKRIVQPLRHEGTKKE